MKASLLFQLKFTRHLASGKTVVIFMDLYELPIKHRRPAKFPEDYKFSWIAFDSETPENRVLFDCHKDKGPHIHFDGQELDREIKAKSPEEAEELFYALIAERFGPLA
jgi:hypothetical protein